MVLLAHDLLRGDHESVQSCNDRECGGYADAEHPGRVVSFGILLRISPPLSRLSKRGKPLTNTAHPSTSQLSTSLRAHTHSPSAHAHVRYEDDDDSMPKHSIHDSAK